MPEPYIPERGRALGSSQGTAVDICTQKYQPSPKGQAITILGVYVRPDTPQLQPRQFTTGLIGTPTTLRHQRPVNEVYQIVSGVLKGLPATPLSLREKIASGLIRNKEALEKAGARFFYFSNMDEAEVRERIKGIPGLAL